MIEGFDANGLVLVTLTYGAVTLIGLARAIGYPNPSAATAWMEGHGLDPVAGSRFRVVPYLRRTRWIRTIGFLAGFDAPYAWMWVTRSAYRMNEVPNLWVVGFAIGILAAEIIRPHATGSATVIEPRRLALYLPDFTRFDRWILTGAVAVLTVLSRLLPVASPVLPDAAAIAREGLAWYLTMALVAVAIITATRVVQELIVHRRQSSDDLDEIRADDAMRSASIQGLAGLGYGGPMWIAATMSWNLAVTSRGPVSWALVILGVLLMGGGLGMLLGFPRLNARWTVPRARPA